MQLESTSTTLLDSLTPKEGEALGLAARQFTNKEIARRLDISSRAVEERLRSARSKLDAPDRRSAARRYLSLLETCERTTCGPSTVDESISPTHPHSREATDDPGFRSGGLEKLHSGDGSDRPTLLEAYDVRFGRIGRIYAVVGLSVMLGLLLIAGVAIAVVARMLI